MPKIGKHQLKRLLEANFDVIAERCNDEEIAIICPEAGCGDQSGNCSINVKQGLVHCWRCNYKNHVIPFLRHHDVSFEEESLEATINEDPTETLDDGLDGKKPAAENVVVELPEGFTPLAKEPNTIYVRLIAQMAKRKHLYLQDFIDAGAGFTRDGEWEPYCIFPVYELSRLVYYQGRTYATRFEGGKTKRFPRKKDVPLGASNWLYGYDRIIQGHIKTVIVVESILNVLSLRWRLLCEGINDVAPVAVFKHAISPIQMTKLLASPAQEFCIMYDGDATKSAWEEARKLSGNRLATVATMPVGIDANDDASLAMARFAKREPYTPASALLDSLELQ